MDFDFSEAFSGCEELPYQEYRKRCAEVSRRILVALNAKVEVPFDDGLSGILLDAIERIELMLREEGEK